MEDEIKKMIIPIAGLGTRFLPMSFAVSKEFLPLANKPVIQYIIEEAKASGIKEVIFVINKNQKAILNYFKKNPEMEKMLTQRNKEGILKELKIFEESFEGINFSFVVQQKPLGDGNAILQAGKKMKKEAVANSFGDDVVDSDEPAILQLINIFKTCNAPVIALKQLDKEKIPSYGMVVAEKIANRLYKIKKIVEKPDISQVSSNLVILGRHVLTPEVFEYLKKAHPGKNGEIILAEVFNKMLMEGKVIYGYEIKGEWLECGDKPKWLKSFFYKALKDPQYGKDLKDYIKTIK